MINNLQDTVYGDSSIYMSQPQDLAEWYAIKLLKQLPGVVDTIQRKHVNLVRNCRNSGVPFRSDGWEDIGEQYLNAVMVLSRRLKENAPFVRGNTKHPLQNHPSAVPCNNPSVWGDFERSQKAKAEQSSLEKAPISAYTKDGALGPCGGPGVVGVAAHPPEGVGGLYLMSWLKGEKDAKGEWFFVRRYKPEPLTKGDAEEERRQSPIFPLSPVPISSMMGRSWQIVALAGQTILGVADIITVLRLMENINQEVYFQEA